MTPLELLEKQSIPYKYSGRDLLVKCMNPDHDDSNPSMRIDSITGVFHCFSCGYRGNLLTRFGVNASLTQLARDKLKDKLETIIIENIGLKMPEKAEFFERPYRGIKADTYAEFEAFSYEGDEFKNYLVFPIYDITGKISLFQGRNMDPDGKPKYKFYPRKVSLPLFPLMKLNPLQGSVVLVEGIFDMLNLWDKGVKNVLTVFGTQSLDEEKVKFLRLMGVSKIYVFFDGDEAGQKAAAKAMALIESLGLLTENVRWNEMDPGSLSQAQVNKLKDSVWQKYY